MDKRQLYLLAACILPLMVCSGLVYSTFSLYLSETLGASRTQIGFLYMLGSLVGFVFAPWLGRLADRVGRKLVMLFSMASFVLVFFAYSIIGDLFWAFPVQALEGASWVAMGAAASAYIADITPSDSRGWGMGVYQQTWSVGWIAGPVMGGALADITGFRITFLIGAVIICPGLISMALLLREPPRSKELSRRADLGDKESA